MAKGVRTKMPTVPKLGVSDTLNIRGFGVHSKFFTPKQQPKQKSGVVGVTSASPKVMPQSSGLGKSAFPPKLKGIP